MECNSDDIGNFPAAAYSLALGDSITSDLNVACGDVDLFRIAVEPGRRYVLNWSRAGIETETALLDNRGWNYWDYSNTEPIRRIFTNGTGTFSFVAKQSDDYFFRIGNTYDHSDLFYSLSFSADNSGGELVRDFESIERFDEPVNGQDVAKKVFTFSARPGFRYALEIIGEDGVDPWIGTQNGGNNIYSSGSGNSARLEFTAAGAQNFRTYYATVGADNPGEFRIKLSSVGDDHAVGTSTTSRITADELVVGNAETGNDIDWFRASLTDGEFYRVKLTRHGEFESLGTPLLIVRDPESELIDISFTPPPLTRSYDDIPFDGVGAESWFQAKSTGDHFLIARSKVSDINGFYQLGYERTRAPITRKYQSELFEENSIVRFDLLGVNTVPVSDFFSAPRASEYQVYAPSTELRRNSAIQESSVIHSIERGELDQWRIKAGSFGTQEIMIRARTGGKWSEWIKTPIISKVPNQTLLTGSLWTRVSIAYHFPESMPSYHGSAYEGFQALPENDPGDSSGLRYNLRHNAWNFGSEAPSYSEDEDSVIQVFIADNVEGYYEAYPPGDDRGGDIILSSEYYDIDTELVVGSREAVEVMRAMGEALGLKTNPDLPQTQSIMGDLSTGIYAIGFMPEDLGALSLLADSEFRNSYDDGDAESGGYISNFRPDIDDRLATGNTDATYPQRIDLQPGGLSFDRSLPEEDRRITVAGNGNSFTAYGGNANDVILGNGGENYLYGNAGGDYLAGRSGDDYMTGGSGSDWYGYRFGDGNDTIREADPFDGNWPGNDTLRLQGFGPFDLGELHDSIEFERMGLDLHVNLALDQGAPDGQVRIEKQAWGSYRVETIELFQDGVRSSPRISLLSVFSQLSDGEAKRFRLTDGADQFGMLVTPV